MIVAGGLEPVLRHSKLYSRPAEIGSFLFMIVTVSGRTEIEKRETKFKNYDLVEPIVIINIIIMVDHVLTLPYC